MIPDFLHRIVELVLATERPETPAAIEPSVPWVLHIEDDADFSDAIKRRLERRGVAVARAFDGMEGFRTAFTRPADAILLDLEMPNGDGDYILSRLKDNPATRDIPVIVITGKSDRSTRRKMLSLGAAQFFTKPVEFEALFTELRRHVNLLPQPV